MDFAGWLFKKVFFIIMFVIPLVIQLKKKKKRPIESVVMGEVLILVLLCTNKLNLEG